VLPPFRRFNPHDPKRKVFYGGSWQKVAMGRTINKLVAKNFLVTMASDACQEYTFRVFGRGGFDWAIWLAVAALLCSLVFLVMFVARYM
jgi:hypothetical protein